LKVYRVKFGNDVAFFNDGTDIDWSLDEFAADIKGQICFLGCLGLARELPAAYFLALTNLYRCYGANRFLAVWVFVISVVLNIF